VGRTGGREGLVNRRRLLGGGVCLALGGARGVAAAQTNRSDPQMNAVVSALVPFSTAPFPYDGPDPETGQPFLDVNEDGRLGHDSPRGGVYWQDQTYSDNRVLIALPKRLDLNRPVLLVVYFHGNGASLEEEVIGRQRVLDQFIAAGLNAALVAPQFAVNALDSSAGGFWKPGAFARFMAEAAAHIARYYANQRVALAVLSRAPVVLAAYSGGYDPAAYALAVGGLGKRVTGVILLDAAFGQADKFADWIASARRHAFFFSAYTPVAAPENAEIELRLATLGLTATHDPPAALTPGTLALVSVPDATHDDFVTDAFVPRPLEWLLSRIPGYPRR
jgi:hypothetical protein